MFSLIFIYFFRVILDKRLKVVIIIDDNEFVHDVVHAALNGLKIRSFYNYESLCVGLTSLSPNICICDMNLGDKHYTGVDCGRLIKNVHPESLRILFSGSPTDQLMKYKDIFHFVIGHKDVNKLRQIVELSLNKDES